MTVGRTFHAAAVYILLAGLQRGMPLIILPFITQVMAPAEYGAASMLTAAALLLTTVIAPLEALVFRAAARGGDDAEELLRVAGVYCYLIVPAVAAVTACLVFFSVPTFLGVRGHIWGIELLAVGFQPAMTYFALPVVQARQKLARFTVLASTSVLLMAASKISLLLVWRLGVLGWVISDLATALVSAAMAMILVRPPQVKASWKHVRSAANFSIPLIPHRVSFWSISSLSRPAMAAVSSLTQVGLLSLGMNVASVASLLLSETNRAVLPGYSRESFPAPTKETLAIVRVQITLAFAVPATVGAGLALVGQFIFSEPYWPSFGLTGILLVGQAAFGLYLVPVNYLVQAAGETRAIALASGGGAILMLGALLGLGRTYGAWGAAFATAGGFLAMALLALSLPRLIRVEIRWRSWLRYWPEVLLAMSALFGAVVALALPVGSWAGRAVAAVCVVLSAAALVRSTRRAGILKV